VARQLLTGRVRLVRGRQRRDEGNHVPMPGFLAGGPRANVCRAVLQSDARPFTAGEEADGLAVDQPYILEVQHGQLVRSVLVDQPLQLGEVLALDATAEVIRTLPA